jgi:hypothetical protein
MPTFIADDCHAIDAAITLIIFDRFHYAFRQLPLFSCRHLFYYFADITLFTPLIITTPLFISVFASILSRHCLSPIR